MAEIVVSPWRRYFVQTLALWAACCILMMMLLDSGRGAAVYSIASGLFWASAATGAFLRPKPTVTEIMFYRAGPLIALLLAFVISDFIS